MRVRNGIWIALALLFALTAAALLHETRGTTLWFDEWQWAMDRRGTDAATFLDPHNGHLSLVPILLYKLLFAAGGLTDYAPYRVAIVIAHLVCVTLVFVYLRRRVGDVVGALGAVVILLLGPAWQNILWPFQIGSVTSLAAGLGALLALDARRRAGDVAACALVALSLASSGLGVIVGDRRRRRRAREPAATARSVDRRCARDSLCPLVAGLSGLRLHAAQSRARARLCGRCGGRRRSRR